MAAKKRTSKRSTPTARRPRKPAPELVSRAELARRKNVSRAAVTIACRGPIAAAVRGDKVDAASPAVRDWLLDDAHVLEPAGAARGGATRASGELPFREIAFRKKKAEAERLESRNARDAGALISRELVRLFVFGALENLSLRIIRDAAQTLTSRLRSSAQTLSAEEALELSRSLLTSEFTITRRALAGALRRCRVGDRVPEVSPDEARAPRPPRDELGIAARLHAKAAPKIFDAIWRSFARVAGGARLDPMVFEHVMAGRAPLEEDSVRLIGQIMTEHVNEVLREQHRQQQGSALAAAD